MTAEVSAWPAASGAYKGGGANSSSPTYSTKSLLPSRGVLRGSPAMLPDGVGR